MSVSVSLCVCLCLCPARNLTCVQVFGCSTDKRNESECLNMSAIAGNLESAYRRIKSVKVRKMVNNA